MAFSFTYPSMGTVWAVTINDDLPPARTAALEAEIKRQSEDFDHIYSRFIPTSLVSRLAEVTGIVDIPRSFREMLEWYEALYEPSGRRFTPLIGHTISDLGYDAAYRLTPAAVIRPTPDFHSAVRLLDGNQIELREPVLFDLGGLGKGYFVDVIAEYLEREGVTAYLVNGSGDIRFRGPAAIRCGLEDPADTTHAIGVLPLQGGALAASGTNRRRWGRHHHVIDPFTRTALATDLSATWVRADRCVLADALASCLFFAPPENFSRYHFEYCLMRTDRRISASPGFDAEFFT